MLRRKVVHCVSIIMIFWSRVYCYIETRRAIPLILVIIGPLRLESGPALYHLPSISMIRINITSWFGYLHNNKFMSACVGRGIIYSSTGSERYRRCPHGQVVRPRFMIGNNPCNRGRWLVLPLFRWFGAVCAICIHQLYYYIRPSHSLFMATEWRGLCRNLSALYARASICRIGKRTYTSFWVRARCLQFNLANEVRIWEETNAYNTSLDVMNNICTVRVIQCTLFVWMEDYLIFICDWCEVVTGGIIYYHYTRNCF